MNGLLPAVEGASAAGDVELRAADVELRNTGGIGVVDAERLDAEEVLAVWEAGWEGILVGVCFVKRELHLHLKPNSHG